MPTLKGKPKVGEFLVYPDGTRHQVLARSSGALWGVKIEWPNAVGYKWIIPAQHYIDRDNIRIEER